MVANIANRELVWPGGVASLQGVPEDEREVAVFRLSCKLHRAGVPEMTAARLVRDATENCTPPFPFKDALMKVVRAYARYPESDIEHQIMREEAALRPDPDLRAFAGAGGEQRADLYELDGEELRAQAQSGTASSGPPSLPFLGQKGYVIEGWSHVIAGYPRCGKTELIVRLCREWLDAGRSVAYLTEEPKGVWQHRLAGLEGDWSRLKVVFALSSALDVLFARAFSGPEDVVVIDTMRNLLQLMDETDNSRIAQVLNPWVAAARRHNKTLIMAHHMRKGGGDHGEGIAGGHALMGVFDVALTLTKEDRTPRRRRVIAYARLLQPPELLYDQESDGSLRYKGDPASVQLAEVVERVRGVLSEHGEEWAKTSQVREWVGEPMPSINQVRAALMQLAAQGEVERDPAMGEEVKRQTVLWRLAAG
ncbi:MAG TPA: AAA family ATPase [Chloroflexia bacterium]|nr:AAA family ATPase [Chloroflexia bacterium]